MTRNGAEAVGLYCRCQQIVLHSSWQSTDVSTAVLMSTFPPRLQLHVDDLFS